MKEPINTPHTGDRVKLRGKEATGILRIIDKSTFWCVVHWDEGFEGPKIVHLHELEKLPTGDGEIGF